MKIFKNKKSYKKIALILSICALVVWAILGTGASLAWFVDTSPEINNIFHYAEFDVELSHRLTDGTWETVDSKTKLFDEKALYEPGYVQVVYLKVDNEGNIPFTFDTAVNVNGYISATNVFGQTFLLQEYLRFGVTACDSEEEMKNSLADRDAAEVIANMPLQNYYETASFELAPGASKYLAIVVRMPKEVTNVANYREPPAPEVELGVTVRADQIRN